MAKHTKLLALVLAAGTLMAAQPAFAGPICLRSRDIDKTLSPDARTIDFYMRDGTVWRNSLKGNCSDLKFSGFQYVIRGGMDQICSNFVQIYVLRSSQSCGLGDFTKLPSPPKAPAR